MNIRFLALHSLNRKYTYRRPRGEINERSTGPATAEVGESCVSHIRAPFWPAKQLTTVCSDCSMYIFSTRERVGFRKYE
jgi:hypothetical protein